jgi:hypothetical protein
VGDCDRAAVFLDLDQKASLLPEVLWRNDNLAAHAINHLYPNHIMTSSFLAVPFSAATSIS